MRRLLQHGAITAAALGILWLCTWARAGVEVYPGGVQTDTLFAEATFVDSVQPSSAFGVASTMRLQQTSSVAQYPLLKWDLAKIPSNHAIIDAKVWVFAQKSSAVLDSTRTLGFRRILHDWEAGGATWDSALVFPGTMTAWATPGLKKGLLMWNRASEPAGADSIHDSLLYDVAQPPVGSFRIPSSITAGDAFSCPMTDAAIHWHSGYWGNYGVLLAWEPRHYAVSSVLILHSDNATDPAVRPIMVVKHVRIGGDYLTPVPYR